MNVLFRWIEGDAIDLPFDDCEFDAVTMGYGLRNVVDRLRAMKEMYRVLKPGRCFVLVYLSFIQGFFLVLCLVISCWFLGSRVSILDFNKSNQSVTTFMQVLVFV